MTPSLRFYAFLCKVMWKLVSPYVSSHPCSKWIKEYSYESFHRLYRQAMRLEMDFFYSRQSEQTLIIPIYTKLDPKEERLILFADFDFTCTSVASLEILANIGEDRDTPSHITSIDLRKTWDLLSKQYTLENEFFIKKLMLGEKAVNFDYERLYSVLVKLSSPGGKAVSRIFDSGVLKGIRLEDIMQKANNLDASVNVMSCWSGDLTRLALSGGLEKLKVDGNEFDYADGFFTGEITRQAHQSVTDKLKYFKDMVQDNESEHGVRSRTVFIGDSVSDLLCLLTADIGIVIDSNKSLIKVGNHFGITFVPLYAGVVKEQKKHFETRNPMVWTGGLSGTLYTITSWIEIHAFILGRDIVNEEL
ncbi:hypothetical protein MKX01_033810 [Papaver californicum]|nr:hypothetical protein MKX01_033810 [Papaver californicum]